MKITYESELEFKRDGSCQTSDSFRITVYPVGGSIEEQISTARKVFRLGPEWRVVRFMDGGTRDTSL